MRALTSTEVRIIVGAATLLFLLSGGRVASLYAQHSVDLGVVTVNSPGLAGRSGVQLTPTLRLARRHIYAEAGGSAASFKDGSWSSDADGLVVWRPRTDAGSGPEIVAGAGLARTDATDLSEQFWGRLRIHRTTRAVDLWLGGGGGRVHALLGGRGITTGELGASWTDGRWSTSAIGTPTWVTGGTAYVDANASARFDGALRVTGAAGFRQMWAPTLDDQGWASVSVERTITPWSSLLLAAGSYPSDPSQGFGEGRYLTLAVRLGHGPRPSVGPPASARAPRTAPSWPRASFELVPRAAGTFDVVLTVGEGREVEVRGDFSDWQPLPLVRTGARWKLRLPLTPGVHRIEVRLDDGPWRAPPSLPTVTDDFGGTVGVLIVP